MRVPLLLALVVGCYPALPTPPVASQEGATPVVVPYPPPAARVDIIGDPPVGMSNPVWVDGQWVFRGRRWTWEPGEWQTLKPKSAYAYPRVVRRSDGQLVWFEGTFRVVRGLP